MIRETLDFPTTTTFAIYLAVSEVYSPKAIILARLRCVMSMTYLIKKVSNENCELLNHILSL
jgi:hypothetical protein